MRNGLRIPPGPRLRIDKNDPAIKASFDDWASLLLYEAEVIAHESRETEVRPVHLDEARVRLRYRPRSRGPAILSYVGCAIFGGGAQGFLLEIFGSPPRIGLTVIFALATVVGLAIGFFFAGRE